MIPTGHPNRRKALANRRGKFWCDHCDGCIVHPGQKCPRCGNRQAKRRLR